MVGDQAPRPVTSAATPERSGRLCICNWPILQAVASAVLAAMRMYTPAVIAGAVATALILRADLA